MFQCSVSCGAGYQQRMVSCIAVPSAPNLQVFDAQSYTQVLSSKCPQPPPPSTQPCQLSECLLPVSWKTGPWSKVCYLICVFNRAFSPSILMVLTCTHLHGRDLWRGNIRPHGHAFSMMINQYMFFYFISFFLVFSDMWCGSDAEDSRVSHR